MVFFADNSCYRLISHMFRTFSSPSDSSLHFTTNDEPSDLRKNAVVERSSMEKSNGTSIKEEVEHAIKAPLTRRLFQAHYSP
jgi:hypothetical protein